MKEQDQNKQQNSEKDSSKESGESTPVYLERDNTLQTPEEARHDKSVDPRFDDQMSVQDHNRFPANMDEIKKERKENSDQ
jgi:hypothetical protein